MAKKSKKAKAAATATNAKSNIEPKKAKPKKRKAAIVREEHPSLVLPAVITAAILLLLGIGEHFELLDRLLCLWIGGGLTVLFFTFAGFYYSKNYLHPKGFKGITTFIVITTLLCGGILVFFASWASDPVADVTVDQVNRQQTVELSSGFYSAFLISDFTEEELNPGTKKKPKSYKVRGDYELTLNYSDGSGDPIKFEGFFEKIRQKRKMARRSRGYLEIQHTSVLKNFRAPKDGAYLVVLDKTAETLTGEFEIKIYKRNLIAYPFMLIGLICVLLANFMDFVIRNGRVASANGQSVGIAFGFLVYFYLESSPIMHFQAMAFDILIGGIMGGVVSYLLYLALKKWYEKLAWNKKISI